MPYNGNVSPLRSDGKNEYLKSSGIDTGIDGKPVSA